MKNKQAVRVIIMLLMTILCGNQMNATTMKRMDINGLTDASSHVVHGKVEKIESAWSSDRKRIVTEIQLRVTEVVKGSTSEAVITLLMPGGTVGDITTVVIGSPGFSIGEESVIFLQKLDKQISPEKDRYGLVGMSQGKFSVNYNEKKKVKEVVSDAIKVGMHLLPDKTGKNEPVGGGEGMSLDELVSKIKNVKSK